MNKSILTNLIAVLVLVVGLFLPGELLRNVVVSVGGFALSGAITNWLAVHMLFERVPGLYGSGVVQLYFEGFKRGIFNLMMDNFFSKENFDRLAERLMQDENIPGLDRDRIIKKVPLDTIFDGLLERVKTSKLGSMLGFLGGVQAIEPLREPFKNEIKKHLDTCLSNPNLLEEFTPQPDLEAMRSDVSKLIEARLEELTPEMVKEIVQQMIREHLDWLVVWGGAFGALIGGLSGWLLF